MSTILMDLCLRKVVPTLDNLVKEIGKKIVVQVVADNGSNYVLVG